MINKKVFALTLVASSVIAAGCSSDDDDDDDSTGLDGQMSLVDMTSDDVSTDAQSRDVNGDGVLDDDDDVNGDGFIDDADVTEFMAMNPGTDTLVDNTTDAVATDAQSMDVDGDGSLTDADDVNGDGVIDDADVTEFAAASMAQLPAGEDYTAPEGTVLTLAELAANTPDLTTLASQVGGCDDLAAALSDPEARLTVFAPNNDAFAAQEVTDALGAGADVCDVIAGHVLVGTVASSTDLAGNVDRSAMTLAGTSVDIAAGAEEGSLTVGGATVVGADNFATNGVAHVIDTVILPAAGGSEDDDDDNGDNGDNTGGATSDNGAAIDAANAAGNTEFASLWTTSALGQALEENQWTVFAPSNDAIDDGTFQTLNASQDSAFNVLNNHIVTTGAIGPDALQGLSEITVNTGTVYPVAVDGDTITVNGLTVTEIESDSDSVVYSIDGVLQ